MIAVTLSKSDFSLLEKLDIHGQLSNFNHVLKNGQIVLEGTINQVEILIDIVSDELSANGFSSILEPTEYGRALERLIDAFSIIYD